MSIGLVLIDPFSVGGGGGGGFQTLERRIELLIFDSTFHRFWQSVRDPLDDVFGSVRRLYCRLVDSRCSREMSVRALLKPFGASVRVPVRCFNIVNSPIIQARREMRLA